MLHKARLGKQGIARRSALSSLLTANSRELCNIPHPPTEWVQAIVSFPSETREQWVAFTEHFTGCRRWAKHTKLTYWNLTPLHNKILGLLAWPWTCLLSDPAITKLYIFDLLSKEYFPQRLPLSNLEILLLCRTKINLIYFLFRCLLNTCADLCNTRDYTGGLVHTRQALAN